MKKLCAVVVSAVALVALSPGPALAASTTMRVPNNPTGICRWLHICV